MKSEAAFLAQLKKAGVADAARKLRWVLEEGGDSAAMVARLCHGEPVQYVLGNTEFMGLFFHCDRRALIPRPETEQLVERVLSDGALAGKVVLDVCTGSGCIAVAIKHAAPGATVLASDLSVEALSLARENAAHHRLDVQFMESDLLDGIPDASVDVLVSNPPYVVREALAGLPVEVGAFEPWLALDGGKDGLDVYRRLFPESFRVLKPDGRLFVEIGETQGEAIEELLLNAGFVEVRIDCDYAGKVRFALARRLG